jgi:SPFH domain / Band 7 family
MRVDIGAEFYLRVKPDASSIALAAQTLGNRTNDAAELRELVEAKFVDGLRSVAATMNLEELQEQRATFVKAVQDAVGADIQNNGLELESVSLTRLDQSDIKHFNPSNFFDAHGLTTGFFVRLVGKRVGSNVLRPDNAGQSTFQGITPCLPPTPLIYPRPSTASPGRTLRRNPPNRSHSPQRRSSRCCCSASAKARPGCCRPR